MYGGHYDIYETWIQNVFGFLRIRFSCDPLARNTSEGGKLTPKVQLVDDKSNAERPAIDKTLVWQL